MSCRSWCRGEGITSSKLYMTHLLMELTDKDMLEVLMRARELGTMTTMIHAEISDMIDKIAKRLIGRGNTKVALRTVARPQLAEAEATNHAISLADPTDTPILIVTCVLLLLSDTIGKRKRSICLCMPYQTCPHYLFLRSAAVKARNAPVERLLAGFWNSMPLGFR